MGVGGMERRPHDPFVGREEGKYFPAGVVEHHLYCTSPESSV